MIATISTLHLITAYPEHVTEILLAHRPELDLEVNAFVFFRYVVVHDSLYFQETTAFFFFFTSVKNNSESVFVVIVL